MDYPSKLAVLLDEVESELKRLDLWEQQPPPARAFASPNPFCFDTMSVPRWLQWVFIYHFKLSSDKHFQKKLEDVD